jgi:hypothetical protein
MERRVDLNDALSISDQLFRVEGDARLSNGVHFEFRCSTVFSGHVPHPLFATPTLRRGTPIKK